ncbi:hypothetical protein LJC19_02195 [Oxalobacter sp. OttesenSCG-928-P03]|nr:hypothetical protein [Oxalobacter sp. OttesenSCG-928-P03]
MANAHAPFYPIIYVRGFAMTDSEIDETTADPFCGFNIGSTVYRAVPEKNRAPRKFIFESPLVRLGSDFGYSDVYEDGYDILDPEWHDDGKNKLPSRSIVIFRYYDEASRLLGTGKVPPISDFSQKLSELILRVRDIVCANKENGISKKDFRCYLVAHSMGGLICRGMLQNPKNDKGNARQYVDKFFTYATPHDGIDIMGMNVPSWLGMMDINNFSREKMADYLDLKAAYKKNGSVAYIPEDRFPSERVFTMVGTNRQDYALAASRTFVGHGSDGLVKIENATLCGLNADNTPGAPCAKAFTYRAHSGYFGIVNSEEAYQNLTRFLFGDVRVDVWVDVNDIRLPEEVQASAKKGNKINALYQFETLMSPRGKMWSLSRRVAEEDSVACLSQEEWDKRGKKNSTLYLSSVFLANRARVNQARPSLAYSMSLGVRMPDYEVERRLWFNEHYEGGYLFRDSIILEMVPPQEKGGNWQVKYAWQGQGSVPAIHEVDTKKVKGGKVEVRIPFDSNTTPGISGQMRFVVSRWNPNAITAE